MCYNQGELYHICEADVNENNDPYNIIKSHFIVRINQYVRTTSSLMLKLGIILRKYNEPNQNITIVNEGKLFKLLLPCFWKK